MAGFDTVFLEIFLGGFRDLFICKFAALLGSYCGLGFVFVETVARFRTLRRSVQEPSWHRRLRRQRTEARVLLRQVLSTRRDLFSLATSRASALLRRHHSQSSLPAQLDRVRAQIASPAAEMAQPWKCVCGVMCRATAVYCQSCGSHWQQATYTHSGHHGTWQWPRHQGQDAGKGGKSPRRPTRPGDGRQGAKTPRSPRRRPKGKGKDSDGQALQQAESSAGLPKASQEQLLKEMPVPPAVPKPNTPAGSTALDAATKLPPAVSALMNALSASKEDLPPEIRQLLEGQELDDHRQTTKQLHKLVSLQSQAKKELSEVKRARSAFVTEWTAYLQKLTTLLQEQLDRKNLALATLAETEEKWLQQLLSSSREIKRQSGTGIEPVDVSSEDDMDAIDEQDAMVAEAAAAEAQRAKATETSKRQELALMDALKQATAAAAAREEEYRERTPRRRSNKASGEEKPEDNKDAAAPKGGADDKTKGAEQQQPPRGAR